MIYTSYFGKAKNLPKDIILISISAFPPVSWKGLQYKKLAPTKEILDAYKKSLDYQDPNSVKDYIKSYAKTILNRLVASDVVNDLEELSNGKDICLLCYETPKNFCHRQIVCAWFTKNKIPCKEYEYE